MRQSVCFLFVVILLSGCVSERVTTTEAEQWRDDVEVKKIERPVCGFRSDGTGGCKH